MARQPVIIGTANAKGGDNLNASFTKINANELELYDDVAAQALLVTANAELIAAKALLITANADAIAAQALLVTANTNAIAVNATAISGFTKTYWFDANDTATATTPISHTGGATGTYLTNNAVGSSTTSYNPDSKAALWTPATNKFDFTSLKIGDTIIFRIDLTIANAAAQGVNLLMSLGEGEAPYELPVVHNYYKTAATATSFGAIFKIYIGDAATRDGGARFRFASAVAASIKVNGWFYKVTEV